MMYVEYFELLIGIGLFHSLMVVDRQHKSLLSLLYTFSGLRGNDFIEVLLLSLRFCSGANA